MGKITKIESNIPALPARKNVAAYARVSMETERLHHSLAAQVSYYSALIQKNPEWEYVGVYADEGISGTAASKRPEFMRMIADCEAGKIDIILTKSISRFARNTVDLLETVRHLKDLGIEVRFEKEHIDSLSGDGEVMLTLLASFAQEETRSISDNVKWGTRKRFEQGIPNGKFRIFGYEWKDDQLVIVPEEAEVVKRIYQNFLDGKSRLETERELEAESIRTRQGCVMRDSNIKQILTNITYTGNMLLQKEYIEDPVSKHRKKNRGELPQYFVENTHEAIIPMKTWQYVQDEMARRKELGALANKSLNTCCFTGKIKCPYCNQSYMHNHRTKNGHEQEYWNCGSKKKKKVGDGCPVGGTINHKNLVKVCTEVLGLSEFDEDVFLARVDYISVPKQYTLEFHFSDSTVLTKDCPNTGHQDCWTAEYRALTSEKRRKKPSCRCASVLTARIKCPHCNCNYTRATQPLKNAENEKAYYWRCRERNGHEGYGFREDLLKPFIADVLGISEFDDAIFDEQIDYINVLSATELEFHFKDGRTETKEWQPPKKQGHKWTDEQRQKYIETRRSHPMSDEQRKAASERMKQIRKERGDNWRKEK